MMVTRKAPIWYHRIVKNTYGYSVVYVPKRGYVLEHRLVMERRLNRRLESTEHVHHFNGIRDDNREKNLTVVSEKDHIKKYHLSQPKPNNDTVRKSP